MHTASLPVMDLLMTINLCKQPHCLSPWNNAKVTKTKKIRKPSTQLIAEYWTEVRNYGGPQ